MDYLLTIRLALAREAYAQLTDPRAEQVWVETLTGLRMRHLRACRGWCGRRALIVLVAVGRRVVLRLAEAGDPARTTRPPQRAGRPARGLPSAWLYNHKRRHSTIGYFVPVTFEQRSTTLAIAA